MREKELPFSDGCLYYDIRRGNAWITGWRGFAGEVAVPGELEGYPVTAVEKKAFLSKKDLRKVSLPDTVEEIGDWAFAYCDNLERVEFPDRDVRFGKKAFLECGKLKKLTVRGKSQTVAALLAAAATVADAPYLLDLKEAGSVEWLKRWDARMLAVLGTSDQEGYSRQVLCGEEDYGSTDPAAYRNGRRKMKVRLLFLRLLHSEGLTSQDRETARDYLLAHTRGCADEETWQVLLGEHGDEREYYELFAALGCLSEENLGMILKDIGEDHPEMKAYFLNQREDTTAGSRFFDKLEL